MSSQLSPTARCEGRFLMGSVDHKIALDLASSGEILYDWRMFSVDRNVKRRRTICLDFASASKSCSSTSYHHDIQISRSCGKGTQLL